MYQQCQMILTRWHSQKWTELSADRPIYREVTSISKHRPLLFLTKWRRTADAATPPGVGHDAARRRAASVVRHPLNYEQLPRNFVAMDCTQLPEILPFGNFFSGNRKFFGTRKNRVPVTSLENTQQEKKAAKNSNNKALLCKQLNQPHTVHIQKTNFRLPQNQKAVSHKRTHLPWGNVDVQSFSRLSHNCGLRAQSQALTADFSSSLQRANQTGTQERYVTPEPQAASQHTNKAHHWLTSPHVSSLKWHYHENVAEEQCSKCHVKQLSLCLTSQSAKDTLNSQNRL